MATADQPEPPAAVTRAALGPDVPPSEVHGVARPAPVAPVPQVVPRDAVPPGRPSSGHRRRKPWYVP